VADAPPEEGAMSNVAPGTVLKATGDNLLIATGAGPLAVHQLQPAGKRMLSVSEFVRGYPLAVGDTLVASPS
jgi:methionyl-tRNA formyltransferase